tara:strand:+ start:48 stop:767 length:720 start_codon:yes stop_codon:yes gene_type:complete
MTTIYDIPNEILTIIFINYCDKKSIIRLNRVNKLFHNITKKKIYNLKLLVHEYSYSNSIQSQNNAILNYIKYDKIDILRNLLELGVIHPNKSITFSRLETIIDYAVNMNKIDMVKLLLQFNCDLNKLNNFGKTPLMSKMENMNDRESDINIIIFLLKNGANPNIEDNCGYIAMDYLKHSDISILCYDIICDLLRYYNSREGSSWSCYSWPSWNFSYDNTDQDTDQDSNEEPLYDTDEES